MQKLIVILFFLSNFLIACKPENKNEINGSTTVEQDKEFINSKVTETLNCIKNFRDGESIKALINFFKLNAGDVENEAWIETMASALETTRLNNIQIDEVNNYKFNFSDFTGVYSWDILNKEFDYSPNNNSIIIKFPSAPDQSKNNITISLTNYKDQIFKANAENIYLPTAITANIIKDEKEIFKLNYSGDYNTVDFPTPKNITLTINLNPQSFSLNIVQASPTKFNVDLVQQSGADCKTEIKSTINFNNSDFKNFEENNDISSVMLTINRGDLSIVGMADPNSIDDIEDPSTAQVNNAFTCEIRNKSSKIGELRFKDVNEERKLFIVYKDFTSEEVTVYTDRFIDGLKDIFEPYFGTINEEDGWF
jgi:hypothetical protein